MLSLLCPDAFLARTHYLVLIEGWREEVRKQEPSLFLPPTSTSLPTHLTFYRIVCLAGEGLEPEGELVPRVIIKVGFLGGMDPDIFPTMDGWAPWFYLQKGKQLLGAQAGSRQVPFSLEALLWVALSSLGAWGLSFRFESGFLPVAVKVNLSGAAPTHSLGQVYSEESSQAGALTPGNVGPHPIPASMGQTIAHITQTPPTKSGQGREWQVSWGGCQERHIKVTSQ